MGGPDMREICNTPKGNEEEMWYGQRGRGAEKGNGFALKGGDTDHILYQADRKA